MKKTRLLILTLILLVLDQASKLWAVNTLILHDPNAVIPMLNWTLAYNEGAAFSFLANQSGWQRWLFSGLALFASMVIFIWILRLKKHEKILGFGLSMILSGAIGNLIDRVRLGKVIDFIDVYYQTAENSYHWPIFNVADMCICIGVVFILLSSFFDKPQASKYGSYN
ncbi:prolipoprotein signal peptidase [Gammaproteobacteria bacterium]|nr:prolipoprotein signal peptidase [Gammaproteobacteria bacterium]